MKRQGKKIIRAIATTIFILCLFITITAFAEENVDNEGNGILQEGSQVKSVNPRGEWLSEIELTIINPQNGNIGVSTFIGCHQAVDEIRTAVYVDVLNESNNTWSQVDYAIFQAKAEDKPDVPLTEMILDFELTGHEVNRWYKLRGMTMVTKGEGIEMLEAETEGIQITKRFLSDESPASLATPSELTE